MTQEDNCQQEWKTALTDDTRRILKERQGFLTRLIDNSGPVVYCAWLVALVVGWRVGMNARALLAITFVFVTIWAYVKEHADASLVIGEMKALLGKHCGTHNIGQATGQCQSSRTTLRRRTRLAATWGMAFMALTVMVSLGVAALKETTSYSAAVEKDVVVAAGHINPGVPLSATNLAYASMPSDFLAKYAYVPARDAYTLLGHKLLASVEYAQLIQWTNTDIVIVTPQSANSITR